MGKKKIYICICFYYIALNYRLFFLVHSLLVHFTYSSIAAPEDINIFHGFLGFFFRHFTEFKDTIFALKSLRECEGLC